MLHALVLTACLSTPPTGSVDEPAWSSGVGDTGGDSVDSGAPDSGDSADTAAPDTGAPDSGDSGADTADTGAIDTADTADTAVDTGFAFTIVPDFALEDLNPGSTRYGQVVSPRDYLEQTSGWYFIHAT